MSLSIRFGVGWGGGKKEGGYVIFKSQIEGWKIDIEFQMIPCCGIYHPFFLPCIEQHFGPLSRI